MKIYAMMFGSEMKYVGLTKSAVEKVVVHQKQVYRNKVDAPEVWLAEMSPIPSPSPVAQTRDSKGRFVKKS
jgi:hypothetical protein